MYRLGRHWNTIQAYLIPGIEDDIGELGEDLRYRRRTGVERVFGMLKDSHGGSTVRVRGNKKVFLHLMFGILVIAAQKLICLAQSICYLLTQPAFRHFARRRFSSSTAFSSASLSQSGKRLR